MYLVFSLVQMYETNVILKPNKTHTCSHLSDNIDREIV